MTNKTIIAVMYLLMIMLIVWTFITISSMNEKVLKLRHGQIILERKR